MRAARVREHVRSNVIGYICLVWLMTGTAVAATQLPAHSVGAKQLRRSAVTNRTIARGAVTASKVKRGALTGRQIKAGSLTGRQIKAGSLTGKQVKAGSLTGTQILASSLGTVPRAGNTDRLGGVAAAGYQRRITGTCATTSAVRQVNADGTVTCEPVGTITKITPGIGLTGGGDTGDVTLDADTTVLQRRVVSACSTAIRTIDEHGGVTCADQAVRGFSETQENGHGANFSEGNFAIGLSCGIPDKVRLLLFDNSGTAATLNWVYNDGVAMQASGNSLANDTSQLLDSAGNRIEGQFILAAADSVTTLNLHALHFLNGGGCEMTGTTVTAPLP